MSPAAAVDAVPSSALSSGLHRAHHRHKHMQKSIVVFTYVYMYPTHIRTEKEEGEEEHEEGNSVGAGPHLQRSALRRMTFVKPILAMSSVVMQSRTAKSHVCSGQEIMVRLSGLDVFGALASRSAKSKRSRDG
jgi:hypothetical protein